MYLHMLKLIISYEISLHDTIQTTFLNNFLKLLSYELLIY